MTALKIIHRQEVPQSARTIALMIGTDRVWETTHQTAGRLFGGYDTGRGTRREVERFIVHPNDIQSLATGEAVVISKLPEQRVQRVRVEPPRTVGPPLDPPGTVEPGPSQRTRPMRQPRTTQRSRSAGRPLPPRGRQPPDSLGR